MKLNTSMHVTHVSDEVWEIAPAEKEGMLVPARIYATPTILQAMDAGVFEQVTNVACLPGIKRYALCMPDGHWGYGFPIGGVAAFDARSGVISPGGVGYDVNCGMRLIRTDLTRAEVQPRLDRLMTELFRTGDSEEKIRSQIAVTCPPDRTPEELECQETSALITCLFFSGPLQTALIFPIWSKNSNFSFSDNSLRTICLP